MIDILATEFSRNSKNCKILLAIFEVVRRKKKKKSSLPFFIILNVHINTVNEQSSSSLVIEPYTNLSFGHKIQRMFNCKICFMIFLIQKI